MKYSIAELRAMVVPPDTTPQAAWIQLKIYRPMSPALRFLAAMEMNDSARSLSAAGVRARHPHFDAEQVRQEVIRMCLGDELFRKAFRASRAEA